MKGPVIKSILAAALLIWAVAIVSCSKGRTDEDLLREAVAKAAEAAEARDTGSFMDIVSKDYGDVHGNDYNAVKGILLAYFLRPGPVKVFITGTEVEVEGEKGRVVAKAVLVRVKDVKSLSDVLPQDAQAFRFDVIFRREGGSWKALSAEWKETGLAGLL